MIAIKIRAVLFLKLSINSNFYLFDTFFIHLYGKQFENWFALLEKIRKFPK
jgi:hypothetical protein